MPTRPRVLVCDDSILMRKVLRDLLSDGGMDVVAEVADGVELLGAVRKHRPDVVTLDIEMPRQDGLTSLAELMRSHPMPVIMCSTLTADGARESVRALALGAVDVVQKPALRLTPSSWGATRDELVEKVRNAAAARVQPAAASAEQAATRAPEKPSRRTSPFTSGKTVTPDLARRAHGSGKPLVIIATSTGGPRALNELVPNLPARLGAGVLIVQHMPVGFTRSLAERLDQHSPIQVREARAADTIEPGVALLAPAGSHLEVAAVGRTRLSDAPPIGKLKPRADVTISSAAEVYRSNVLLVVLTGMGSDGEAGARDLKRAGGRILTEHERTCVIYGMPRAVAEAGLSDGAIPLDVMPLAITETVAAWSASRR